MTQRGPLVRYVFGCARGNFFGRSSSIARSASISLGSSLRGTHGERAHRATESVPEVVYLMGLFADEYCCAWLWFSLLQHVHRVPLAHFHQSRAAGFIQWNYPVLRRWSAIS